MARSPGRKARTYSNLKNELRTGNGSGAAAAQRRSISSAVSFGKSDFMILYASRNASIASRQKHFVGGDSPILGTLQGAGLAEAPSSHMVPEYPSRKKLKLLPVCSSLRAVAKFKASLKLAPTKSDERDSSHPETHRRTVSSCARRCTLASERRRGRPFA